MVIGDQVETTFYYTFEKEPSLRFSLSIKWLAKSQSPFDRPGCGQRRSLYQG
jgi:hypothetical protein